MERTLMHFELRPVSPSLFSDENIEENLEFSNLAIQVEKKDERIFRGKLIFQGDWLNEYSQIKKDFEKFFRTFKMVFQITKLPYIVDENDNIQQRLGETTIETVMHVGKREEIINLPEILKALNSYFSMDRRTKKLFDEIAYVYLNLTNTRNNPSASVFLDLNYIIQFILKNFKKILKNREMNVDEEKLIRESKEYFKNQTKRSWRSIKVNIEPSYVKEVSILFDEYFKLNHEEILLLILIRPLRNVMAHLENRKDPVKVRGIIRDFARREISNYTSILKKVMNKLLEIDWDIKEGERIIFSNH